MDPEVSPFSSFFGNPGEAVPEVDAADMKAVYQLQKSLKAQRGPGTAATGVSILQQACNPGANIGAIWYRLSMLGFLEMFLEATWSGGQLTDAALEVAATMPLTWVETGKPLNGFPFDEAQFLTEVFARSQTPPPKPE